MRIAILLTLLLSACTLPPPPDTARVPPNTFAMNGDQDVSAVNFAAYAFGDAARTAGRPVEAARGVAAMEYIAGQFNTSPRWIQLPLEYRQALLPARVNMRATLGVAADAPSQAVVNGLLAAQSALLAGDITAARAALPTPIFPADMLERLANMPFMLEVNVATTHLSNAMMVGAGTSGLF